MEMEHEIEQLYDNKDFFAKAQKDLNDSGEKSKCESPQSSCCGESIHMSGMQFLQDDFNLLEKEFMDLGINCPQELKA